MVGKPFAGASVALVRRIHQGDSFLIEESGASSTRAGKRGLPVRNTTTQLWSQQSSNPPSRFRNSTKHGLSPTRSSPRAKGNLTGRLNVGHRSLEPLSAHHHSPAVDPITRGWRWDQRALCRSGARRRSSPGGVSLILFAKSAGLQRAAQSFARRRSCCLLTPIDVTGSDSISWNRWRICYTNTDTETSW